MLRKAAAALMPASIIICGLITEAIGPGESAFAFAIFALLILIPFSTMVTWSAALWPESTELWSRVRMISILIFIISLIAIVTIAAGGILGFEGMMLSWIAVWLLSILIIRRIRNSQPEISVES
jgi:hypothetical protein